MTGRTRPLERHPGLAMLAATQRGVVRRSQLSALAITRDHVRRQVLAQRWRLLGPNVVVLGTGVLTREQSYWAAVLHAGTEAALAGLTSLEQEGLTGWFRRPVHVVVPRGVSVSPMPGLVVHSTRYEGDQLRGAGEGCPATPPARSTVDAARWLRSPRAMTGLVMAVVQQRLATPAELSAVVDGLGSFPQRSLVVDAIHTAAGGSDSLAEADVARMCAQLGLTSVRQQVRIDTPDGPRRVDLSVDLPDGRRLVIEVDGPHHADPEVRVADGVKDAALIAAGHLVLRVPVVAIRRRPGAVLRQLAAIRDAAMGASRNLPV